MENPFLRWWWLWELYASVLWKVLWDLLGIRGSHPGCKKLPHAFNLAAVSGGKYFYGENHCVPQLLTLKRGKSLGENTHRTGPWAKGVHIGEFLRRYPAFYTRANGLNTIFNQFQLKAITSLLGSRLLIVPANCYILLFPKNYGQEQLTSMNSGKRFNLKRTMKMEDYKPCSQAGVVYFSEWWK